MSIRPYRDIHRRQCRKIHVGKVPVGGDAPITVQSMTNTVTSDVEATVEQVRALEEAGADIVRVSCPDQESALALKHIVRQVTVPIVADIHFHYKRAIEAAESGAACLRINPGNIGSADAGARGHQGGQGPRLLDAHRRQCRLARARPAGELWRAVPRGDGRERAQPRQDPRRQRFLRVQDLVQGVRRVSRGRRLSAARRGLRLPAASRHHRGRRPAQRHGQILDRARHAAVVRDRRHDPRVAVGRPGRGGQGRLRDAEIAGPAAPRRHGDLLPVLRPPAIRGHQDRRAARGAPRAHHDAADRCR